jgi:sugar/nucleoside kinase (ribokinase family)
MTAPLELLGIGNAIVDVISRADDALLADLGLAKGSMTLVDEQASTRIYARMGPGTEVSGGSCANTIAGFASFGGHAGYVGKVRDDQLGEVFRHDITALGVVFTTAPATAGPSTARCLILVTPDAQRTMATYLGACVDLGPEDLDRAQVAAARTVYLEGYLFDPPRAQEAFRTAAGIARAAGARVALTLSDSFCVDRHRQAFIDFTKAYVDVLFANESEILALTGGGDFEAAARMAAGLCPTIALTRSEKGSVVLHGGRAITVPAHPVAQIVDTTGAGDLYAAGFLFGLARDRELADCARLGGLAAAEVISHVGPRPIARLADLAARELPFVAG